MEAMAVAEGDIHCRTLWISDVHLGTVHCKAEHLLALLERVRCERLYLVGDIVDIWAMQRRVHWPESHNRVVRKLLKLSRRKVEVIYIPGNHDQTFREFTGASFGRVRLRQQAVHTTASGKRFLVTHGDELDYAVRYSRLTRVIGDFSYDLLMSVNRWVNHYREWRGKPYWSLARWVKGHIAQAEQAITAYQEAAVNLARQRNLDGIICGHLHHPVVQQYGEVLYCNDGDWVENCTALVEDFQGELHLLRGINEETEGSPILFAQAEQTAA